MIINTNDARCFDIDPKKIGGVLDIKYSIIGAGVEATLFTVSPKQSDLVHY